MAAEMGEIDEMHSNDDGVDAPITNGNASDDEISEKLVEDVCEIEDVDEDELLEMSNKEDMDVDDDDDDVEMDEEAEKNKEEIEEEVHEIIDDDDEDENQDENKDEEEVEEEEEDEELQNGMDDDEPIELNDSGDGEGDGDVVIVESKENGRVSGELEVIEIDGGLPDKKKKAMTPRRSTRNRRSAAYIDDDDGEKNNSDGSVNNKSSEESDIEEVFPEDPLAVRSDDKRSRHLNSSTIVVKDTKRLVEIAAKSNSHHSGNKKEPTLVIIDTNSILSGRGPVPVHKDKHQSSYSLPMALPAQGMYPANMRATITPIPLTSSSTSTPPPPPLTKAPSSPTNSSNLAPVLPTLTDDMFVVEAPSFIVPYVYEKPPMTDFKNFLKELIADKDSEKDKSEEKEGESDKTDDGKDDDADSKKGSSYFESPLGKFFIDIGFNQVQEFVQSDLLRQQKKKRDREGGQNPTTNKTIHSLMKDLENTKENNESFRRVMKKCEFCNFKTESFLVMAHHLETPHTKNYVYKCNFCSYEARSPHDILFHMEAEHAVRGRLDRAPSFHQCPNCPFEDNQKGKLSRHLVACMRKFKPEKNLEPPMEWEPPAKIPRVPKTRQGVNVSAYQALKSSQLQFLSKMQLLNSNNSSQHALHRGRGRPTLGTNSASMKQVMRASGMVYKQTMSGGSVLVPTNYQLSGNQVYQVLGGQELGGRLSHPGHMAFVPNVPSASGTGNVQNQSPKNKSVHQPSISITPLPRASSTPLTNANSKPGDTNSKNSFVICEICDGYIKDLEQLRNHMQWIHKVKIHPKMIYNRPPLNCQKCQFRFFTDQGLERHLLGSHGLVTSSMQDAANRSKDSGRCPVCGRVYQWKLLNHVARDHNMTLKPAHLSYKCTVCTATFSMYKQFENHVYSAHSVVAKRVMDKKISSSSSSTPTSSSNKNDQIMKPLKINDEITIIPQPAKVAKEESPSTSKNAESTSPRESETALVADAAKD